MCKLTKNLPIQGAGGCWIFRIQAEDLTRGWENSERARPPFALELCMHKKHLNRQILYAKNV